METSVDIVKLSDDVRRKVEEIRKRTVFHDPPSAGFDPLRATDEELEFYALPPRPVRKLQPRLRRFWDAFFTPVADKTPLFRKGEILDPLPYLLSQRFLRSVTPSRRESSLNWSGSYVKPHHGAAFTQVIGDWTVPAVQLPGSGMATQSYQSSTWIGLDGQRPYRHSSLPQIGTSQFAGTLPNNAPPYAAWYQWWERGHTSIPMPLNLPVAAGSLAMAMMLVLSATKVRFLLRVDNNWIAPFDVTSPFSAETVPVQYRVSGATAQWIMERPSDLNPPHLPYQMPKYSDFCFRNCLAIAKDALGNTRSFTLRTSHLIRMMDKPTAPHRRRLISVARRTGQQELCLKYVGP